MKRVLIISPYFPPSNAADMQRVRMSLPYFNDFGWEAEVITVNPLYSEAVKDPLLMESIPEDTVIHYVSAFSKKITALFGLGSIALRSLYFYKRYADNLLESKHFDLIYFSTTQFPVCILGAYWKKKFKIPYIIDMQDPWHSDYYKNKPAGERPKKYWFSYRMNKFLEPVAMNSADGIVSVSAAYIRTLHSRHRNLRTKPAKVVTFGAFDRDFEIAEQHRTRILPAFKKKEDLIQVAYVGRGGYDMQPAAELLFTAFKEGLELHPHLFSKIRFHFIGTSYASEHEANPTFMPAAEKLGLTLYVDEQTGRIGFYETISTLQQADALLVMGSDDPHYTASKIYPYILANKPLLAIFNSSSSAAATIRDCNAGFVADLSDPRQAVEDIFQFLSDLTKNNIAAPVVDGGEFVKFTARTMTAKQCELFNEVLFQVGKQD